MGSLRQVLHGIAGAAFVASTGSCLFGGGGAEVFSTPKLPDDAAKGIAVEPQQCAELCRNARATACSIATRSEGSLLVECRGRQHKSEARTAAVGGECNFRMGHPKANGCRYVGEDATHLEAEWSFGFSGVGSYEGGMLVVHGESCKAWCGRSMDRCEMTPNRAGIRTQCQNFAQPGGRRPAGMVDGPIAGEGIPRALREAVRLEAASVTAFRQLARELEANGAPEDLVRRARSAARDEARHAREVRRVAAERGVEVALERTPLRPNRTLREVAIENAVEGCVRETWGALVALWQARAAPTELREVFARIAEDEIAHAELAWDVDRWSTKHLSERERAEVREAARRAVDDLDGEFGGGARGDLEAQLGLPGEPATRDLLERLRAGVLAPGLGWAG